MSLLEVTTTRTDDRQRSYLDNLVRCLIPRTIHIAETIREQQHIQEVMGKLFNILNGSMYTTMLLRVS